MMFLLQWTAAIIDMIAAFMFARDVKLIRPARYLCLTGNIIWLIYGSYTGQFGIVVLNIVYFICVSYALYNYRKNFDAQLSEIKKLTENKPTGSDTPQQYLKS